MKLSRGFTIVELLVATTLMLILAGSVIFVFITAQKIYSNTDALVQVYQNARYALDQIERDVANISKTTDMEFFSDKLGVTEGAGHYDPGEEVAALSGRVLPGQNYIYAPLIYQPEKYVGTDRKEHRHDQLYFRTITTVEGKTKQALIHYHLDDTDQDKPVLRKTIAHVIDKDPNTGKLTVEVGEPIDLCFYVTDIEIEFFYGPKRVPGSGRFMSAKEAIEPSVPPTLRNWASGADSYAVSTLEMADDGRLEYIASEDEVRFYTSSNSEFEAVVPGDKLFVQNPDNGRSADYTVSEVVEETGTTYLLFREKIDVTQLAGSGKTKADVNYRIGWLPAAFKVKLTIKDARNFQRRTIMRIFKVLKS